MKNFKYVMMMAAALVLGLSSCSSDDENSGGDNSKPKSVFLKITNGPDTYGEGAAVADNTTVGFSSGEVFFVNGSGAILDHYTITSAPTAGTNINMTDITGTGASLTNLNGGITNVHIVGNVPASVTLPTSGNISAVKEKVLTIATQSDITKVNLYGTNGLTLVSGDQYTSTVALAPTVARVELTDVKIDATSVITGFQVDGIFIDNYYSKGNVGGSLLAADLVGNGTTAANFADNTAAYPTALKPFVYDWYASGLAASGTPVVAKPAGTNVWGYNLFAEAAGSAVPRIVIRMSNFTTSDSSTIASPQFVTIKGMKSSGTPLSAIIAGEIYNIGAGKLVIDETKITPTPNQKAIDIDVKVTLAKWKVIAVTPEI